MKYTTPKNKTISLRINEEDFNILHEVSKLTGQKSVSNLVRSLCNISINAYKYQVKAQNIAQNGGIKQNEDI